MDYIDIDPNLIEQLGITKKFDKTSRKIIDMDENSILTNKAQHLRLLRESECFPIINRGHWWFETLTDNQKDELRTWYEAWLNAPKTKEIPLIPEWLINLGEI